MKVFSTIAIALAMTALAGCHKSANEAVADNVEANAENTADAIKTSGDNMEAAADNQADAVRAAGDNTANAIRDGNSTAP